MTVGFSAAVRDAAAGVTHAPPLSYRVPAIRAILRRTRSARAHLDAFVSDYVDDDPTPVVVVVGKRLTRKPAPDQGLAHGGRGAEARREERREDPARRAAAEEDLDATT